MCVCVCVYVCVCVCNSLIDHNISPYFYGSKFSTYEFIFMIVRSLHMNLQVANFQRCKRIFACPITEVSPGVWHTLSHVCLLCKWLCLCVLHCILLYIAVVVRCLYFKPRMSRSKCKSRSDAHVQPLLKPEHPRARALQQEKPLQWEAQVSQLESSHRSPQLQKTHAAIKTQYSQKIFVGLTNKLDLKTHSWNGTCSYVGDLPHIVFIEWAPIPSHGCTV